jgi:hypothetical protein
MLTISRPCLLAVAGIMLLVPRVAFSQQANGPRPTRALIAAQSADAGVRAWVGDGPILHLCDGPTGRELRQVKCPDADLRCVAVAPDGTLVAAADQFGTVYLWETATGTALYRLTGPECSMAALVFSPSGKLLATAGNQSQDGLGIWVDGTLCAWEVATGKEIRRLVTPARRIAALAFTRDGTAVTCTCGGQALRWEPFTGSESGSKVVENYLRARAPMGNHAVMSFASGGTLVAVEPLSGPPWNTTQQKDLWKDLAEPDPASAYEVVGLLAAAPGPAESLLAERLHPVPLDLGPRVDRLLRELDDKHWTIRERAEADLEALGDETESYLRRALQKPPSLEVNRRVHRLIERIETNHPSPESLRSQRAVEVLEELGTPAARHLLEALAHGAPAAGLTRDAQAALQRLARR